MLKTQYTHTQDIRSYTHIHIYTLIHTHTVNKYVAIKKMLPLTLLKTAENHPMLIELKNGDTYNGRLVSCNIFMNILLKDVICTSRDGDRFWKIAECYVRGNSIKYLRIPDEIVDLATEQQKIQKDAAVFRNVGGRGGTYQGRGGGGRDGAFISRGGRGGRGDGGRGGRTGDSESSGRGGRGRGEYQGRGGYQSGRGRGNEDGKGRGAECGRGRSSEGGRGRSNEGGRGRSSEGRVGRSNNSS